MKAVLTNVHQPGFKNKQCKRTLGFQLYTGRKQAEKAVQVLKKSYCLMVISDVAKDERKNIAEGGSKNHGVQ